MQAWEATLIDVIKQEMLHLALATNILTAVGAAPHFERPNLPILSRWYPPGVQMALLPFGEQALRHFMYLERPEGMTLEDAEGFAAQPGIQPLARIDRPVAAVAEPWQTVGHLCRGIEAGLAGMCDRYGEDAVFIGPPGAQAVTATFEWKELTAVTGLVSAGRAIELIVEQGEGRGATGSSRTLASSWGSWRTSSPSRRQTPASTRCGRSSPPTSGCPPTWRRGR